MDPFAIQSGPAKAQRPLASWAPAVCSTLVWGLGQLWNRDKRKALIFFSGQCTSTLYLWDFFHQGVLFSVMVSHFGETLWTLAMVPISLAALSLWAFNVLDAWRMAQFLDAIAYRTVTLEHDVAGWDFEPRSNNPEPFRLPFKSLIWILAAIAVAHWSLSPTSKSIHTLIEAVEKHPNSFPKRRQLILAYRENGQKRQALLEAEDLLSNQSSQLSDFEKQWLQGILEGLPSAELPNEPQKDSSEPEFVVEAVLESPGEDWDQLFETLSPQEFETRALLHLRKNPEDLRPLELLLHRFVKEKRWEDVQRVSRDALRANPQLPWLLEASALAESRLLKVESGPDEAELAQTLKAAVEDYRSQNLRQASEKLEHYFQQGGKDKEAWLLKNAIAFQNQDYAAAANTLENALRIWPDDFLFQYSMGKAQYRRDRFAEAATWFERILQKEPQRTEVLKNLGLTYRKLGRTQDSIPPLEKALKHEPADDSVKLLLGLSLLETGQSGDALQHFRELTLRSPDHPLIDYYRGRAEQAEGFQTDALSSYRQVPRNSPVRADALKRAKALQAKLNQPPAERGNESTQNPVTRQPEPTRVQQVTRTAGLLEQAERAWQDERYTEAVSLYQEILKEEPTHFRALSQLGRWEFEQQGSYERAKVYLDQALSLRPDDIWVNLSLGVIAKAMGSSYDAIRYFETVLNQDPQQLNANFNLALLYEDRGDLQLAKDYYSRVIRHHPEHLLAYNYYGDISFNEGDFHKATELYSEVLKHSPANTGIRFKLALSLEKEQNYPQALKELRALREESGNEPMIREELNSAITRVEQKMQTRSRY